MDIETLAPLLTGPGSAVLVLLGVIFGVYRVTVRYLVPMVSRIADRHLAVCDALIDKIGNIDRSIGIIDHRLKRIESALPLSIIGAQALTKNGPGCI